MKRIGRASILCGPGGPFVVEEAEVKDPQPGGLLLKVQLCGICGTDVHIYKGQMQGVPFPLVIGHEPLCTVEAMGTKDSTDYNGRPLKEGDYVYLLGLKTCGKCYNCTIAFEPSACYNGMGYSAKPFPDEPPHFQGGYSQYIDFRPEFTGVYKVDVDQPEKAVIMEPIAVGIHAADCTNFRVPSTVVVQGAGATALGTMIAAREAGASKIIVLGAPKSRLVVAKEFGADVVIDIDQVKDPQERIRLVKEETRFGLGADIVFEVTGVPGVLVEGIAMMRNSGQFITLGHFTDNGTAEFNPFKHFTNNQITLRGVWGAAHHHMARAVPIIESGKYPLEKMISHKLPLEKVGNVMDQLAKGMIVDNKEVIKAAVAPWI
ncbi:MAG: hypothetical protein EHM41_09125 [Chloroflexi bacterium]|nr:MAG: hypothetical protein EHM41_09125 [Chloroflexota bacterium]